MKKIDYDTIKIKAETFIYHSFHYVEYDEIKEYEVLLKDNTAIIVKGYSIEEKSNIVYWAVNDQEVLIEALNKFNLNGVITFVPENWVDGLKANNFCIYAVWNDYFNDNISKVTEEICSEFLETEEAKEASEITLSCRQQSRGFSGQSEDWIRQWMKGTEANAVRIGCKDNTILVHREAEKIEGVICVAIYGHNSDMGPVIWIRELAVSPAYQRRGIAKKLLKQALIYGRQHGATRSFLMADECNKGAISLYESLGYRANKSEAEIDMIRKEVSI